MSVWLYLQDRLLHLGIDVEMCCKLTCSLNQRLAIHFTHVTNLLVTSSTHLDEVAEGLLAGGTGEAAVHRVHPYVVFEHVKSFKGFRA